MGLRELFILVLGLAIVAVFLRGVYVAIKARKGQLRIQLDKNVPDYDPEELTLSELPNGGARLVERSFAQVVKQNSDFAKKDKKTYGSKSNKNIPVLMDSVDDDVPERTSTIASARQSARKNHVMGRSETATSQLKSQPLFEEPTEPSDANVDVPVDSAPSSPNVENDEYDHKLAPKQEEPYDDYDDDPIANHVFVDEAAETGELAPESYSAEDDETLDEEYVGYLDDDIDAEDESESLIGSGAREADDTLEDNSDYADEDLLEHDEDAFEDEDFAGDGPDALDNGRNQSADDLEEDEDYEDYEDEDEDELEGEYTHENTEHKGFSALDDDSELEDEETDLDDAEDDDDYDDDDAELDDQFDEDDDDEYDHDYDEPAAHEKEPSGPRSWLKWAGNKISEMSGSSGEDEAIVRSERAEPVIGQSSFDEVMAPLPESKPKPRPERSRDEPASRAAHFDKTHQSQLDLGTPAVEQPAPRPAREQKRAEVKVKVKAEPVPVPEKKGESAAFAEFSEVLVINVVAKPDRDIAGIDMLQVLMANGLIFGDMSIFHRHLEHNRESPVLFSVANMVNPGTFDLNQIGEFATKGLCFFLTLPNVATSMQAFEKMLDAAQKVRVALDCDLKDDSRSVMTSQTIEHYRQRVRDFDLRQLRQTK